MKLFLIGVYLTFSFGPCWAAGAGAPPGLNTQAGSPVNVPKKADDIDGRKKLYVGRVLAQVNQVYPADFFANLTPQDKDALTAAGSKIEGNKLVMPASPLAGCLARTAARSLMRPLFLRSSKPPLLRMQRPAES